LSGWPCGPANRAKTAAKHGIGRQSESHNVKNIEEFCAKLQDSPLAIAATPKRSVLDYREIELMETGSAKGVTAERPEYALIGTGAVSNMNRN
jgi:hypothetical protein